VVHHGDPVQLERMLVNLLTNAVKFTPDGGRVELQLRTLSEKTEIVVSDTGVGIPEDEQSKLFTRFFRSSTATERAIQGTGLGLTIVKAIVALHGGRIEVESAHQRGTTVTVSLPRKVELAAANHYATG
jgi:signal transduction histidine kinase